jgi:hypothetical protein
VQRGRNTRLARVRSEGGIIENSEIIYRMIKDTYDKENKQTVIVGHSKGALDSLCAIARHNVRARASRRPCASPACGRQAQSMNECRQPGMQLTNTQA